MRLHKRVNWLNEQPRIREIWQYLDDILLDIVASAVMIQQIPAPTFHEVARANHVLSQFGALGLRDCAIDHIYNAFGCLPGSEPGQKAVLLSAHTDTVFPADTDLTIRYEGESCIYGAGLGDNSMGVAGLLAVAEICNRFGIQPTRDIWFLANSCEEGLGDLKGIRAFYDTHGDALHSAIILEGMAFGQIVHAAVAIRRLHVQCRAAGGHSWYHYGQPTAIHSLLRLGAEIVQLRPSVQPRTTYNVGLIEGGQSVNSLASTASFTLDMRSETPEALQAFEDVVRTLIHKAEAEEGISYQVDVVGDRPAGGIPHDHELLQAAVAALRCVNVTAGLKKGSTDANLTLSKGLPSVTIGLTTGGNAHQLNEYINTDALLSGLKQVILLTLAAAEWNAM